MSQAGKSAARPKNQWCCGRQLDTHLLKYGTTTTVPSNPMTPIIIDALVICYSASLRHRRCGRGRPVLAVGILDLLAHFLEAFTLIHHCHHVTRDAYADPSGQAHSIKYQIPRS